MTTTPPRIDPRLGAAALRAPAASMVDSRPQAILKLHRPSSLDYRARHGSPVKLPNLDSHYVQRSTKDQRSLAEAEAFSPFATASATKG